MPGKLFNLLTTRLDLGPAEDSAVTPIDILLGLLFPGIHWLQMLLSPAAGSPPKNHFPFQPLDFTRQGRKALQESR